MNTDKTKENPLLICVHRSSFVAKNFFYAPVLIAAILTGCSPGDRPEMMGETNLIAVEGTTPQELRAPENGRIAVYDITEKKMLFSNPISSGQSFVIDPVGLQAAIDGKPIREKLPGGHELKVIFTPTD